MLPDERLERAARTPATAIDRVPVTATEPIERAPRTPATAIGRAPVRAMATEPPGAATEAPEPPRPARRRSVAGA